MACELGDRYGVRNSQASVLAPTGTIGLMMDCDTTGIEPDLGLVKMKKLVGGGTMSIVNQTVPRALDAARLRRRPGRRHRRLHRRAQVDRRRPAPRPPSTCRCSPARWATTSSTTSGHVRMMAAVQPFISRRHLEDREHARRGDGRGGRAAPHRRLAAGRQGHRHLPRQLQGRPAAVDRQEGRRRRRPSWPPAPAAAADPGDREDHQGPGAREAAPQPHVADVRVPGGRLQGLRHRRRVRRTGARARSSSRCRSRARPSPASWTPSRSRSATACSTGCRCATSSRRSPTPGSSRPASPTTPTCASPRRSSTTSSGAWRSNYLSYEERAELGILTTGERTQPTLPGVEETVDPDPPGPGRAGRPAVDRLVVADAVRHGGRPEGAVAARAGRGHRRREAGDRAPVPGDQAAGGHQHRRPVLHAVRRADAAGRLVPRLPLVRQHQRLQLTLAGRRPVELV